MYIYQKEYVGHFMPWACPDSLCDFFQNHGYDNNEPSMRAMFVAHGPFSTDAKTMHHGRKMLSYLPRWPLYADKGWHSTSGSAYVMNGFQNVEIYNLIMKLLGIEAQATKTNGTIGFWDKYL
jgi:hypothetical protein